MSDLSLLVEEVESFNAGTIPYLLLGSNDAAKLSRNSLEKLTNKRKEVERVMNKLKDEVASQEMVKRGLLDNVTLRETKEAVDMLEEKCKQLREKLNSMNYNEMEREWKKLGSEKQTLLRQVNDVCVVYYLCPFLNLFDTISEECSGGESRGVGKNDQTVHARIAKRRIQIGSS